MVKITEKEIKNYLFDYANEYYDLGCFDVSTKPDRETLSKFSIINRFRMKDFVNETEESLKKSNSFGTFISKGKNFWIFIQMSYLYCLRTLHS